MSNATNYTPGYTDNAVSFMARRTAESHAGFFTPFIRAGMDLLDCGCGPGAITCGLAKRVAPGQVVGVDSADSQIRTAEARAADEKTSNARFQTANASSLPFPPNTFDAVFSHALLEHVTEPTIVVREFFRVLRPGGLLGVRSPDWGGFIIAPTDPAADAALIAYRRIQEANGGDTSVGRKIGEILASAGFTHIKMGADYECYSDREVIADYLALQLKLIDSAAAEALIAWSQRPNGLFAQAWVNAVGWKPEEIA